LSCTRLWQSPSVVSTPTRADRRPSFAGAACADFSSKISYRVIAVTCRLCSLSRSHALVLCGNRVPINMRGATSRCRFRVEKSDSARCVIVLRTWAIRTILLCRAPRLSISRARRDLQRATRTRQRAGNRERILNGLVAAAATHFVFTKNTFGGCKRIPELSAIEQKQSTVHRSAALKLGFTRCTLRG